MFFLKYIVFITHSVYFTTYLCSITDCIAYTIFKISAFTKIASWLDKLCLYNLGCAFFESASQEIYPNHT